MKMKILNNHCTGYEYLKDSSVIHSDISCFDLTVALSNKKYKYKKKEEKKKKKRMRYSQSVEIMKMYL